MVLFFYWVVFLDGEHYPNVSLCVGVFSLGAEERVMVKNEGRNGGR